MEAIDLHGKPVIAAIYLNAKEERQSGVNQITSVYGKDRIHALQNWLEKDLLCVNPDQAKAWFGKRNTAWNKKLKADNELRGSWRQLPEDTTVNDFNIIKLYPQDVHKYFEIKAIPASESPPVAKTNPLNSRY